MTTKNRSSNFELLRIISMLMIVAGHFVAQSKLSEISGGGTYLFECVIGSGARAAVAVFVMLGAWFMVDKEFKFARIFKIWLQTFFYCAVITLLCAAVYGFDVVGIKSIVKAFLPIIGRSVWFPSTYIVLLFLSPFLNWYIHKAPFKILTNTVILSSVIIVIIPSLTPGTSFFEVNTNAAAIFVFCYLYMFIGYIKKYEAKLPHFSQGQYALAAFLSYFCLVSMRFASKIIPNPKVSALLYTLYEYYKSNFNTIFNMVLALSLLMLFKNMRIKHSRLINTIASGTFGVYIIHQVPVFYPILWDKWVAIERFQSSSFLIAIILLVVFTIFILADLIDVLCNKYIISNVSKWLLNKKFVIKYTAYIENALKISSATDVF